VKEGNIFKETLGVRERTCEVPLDVVAQKLFLRILKKFVQGVSSVSVHFNFRKQWELGPILLGKAFDFGISAWFLATKLVARESQNFKAPRLVLIVHSHQFLVVLVS